MNNIADYFIEYCLFLKMWNKLHKAEYFPSTGSTIFCLALMYSSHPPTTYFLSPSSV